MVLVSGGWGRRDGFQRPGEGGDGSGGGRSGEKGSRGGTR